MTLYMKNTIGIEQYWYGRVYLLIDGDGEMWTHYFPALRGGSEAHELQNALVWASR